MERLTFEYRAAHIACPTCTSSQIFHTTAGGIYVPDTNKAKCMSCGWVGIVHDLKPVEA